MVWRVVSLLRRYAVYVTDNADVLAMGRKHSRCRSHQILVKVEQRYFYGTICVGDHSSLYAGSAKAERQYPDWAALALKFGGGIGRDRSLRDFAARTSRVNPHPVTYGRIRDLSKAASHLYAAERKVELRVFLVSMRPG